MVLRCQLTNLQRNNQAIEVKHQMKYLGIIFQENGLYNAHISYVHTNVSNALICFGC